MSIAKVIHKYEISAQPGDYTFWRLRPPEERLRALEEIRREYNSWKYDDQQGLQRIYRIIKRQ